MNKKVHEQSGGLQAEKNGRRLRKTDYKDRLEPTVERYIIEFPTQGGTVTRGAGRVISGVRLSEPSGGVVKGNTTG